MKKNIKILFVPDIHGRDFWRKSVLNTLEKSNAKIVFLGDYIDPYEDDFIEQMEADSKFDYRKYSIDVLNDIIDLKYKYPDRIILLQGNHDTGYSIGKDICESRRDYLNAATITEIFRENWDKFQLAYEETINGVHFVFSHAGISTDFMEKYYNVTEKDKMVDFLNNIWLTKEKLHFLGVYDNYRGYGGTEWASPIWADIRQMSKLTKENTVGDFQIVGHTQLINDGTPYISDYIGDFDCRECFYIDDKGNIRNYKTDGIIRKKD